MKENLERKKENKENEITTIIINIIS